MKKNLRILLFLTACVLLQTACTPPKPAFEFIDHQLKIAVDPDNRQFIALDTVSIRYHKNIDSVYFLLRDSLRVERVGISHQSFRLIPLTARKTKSVLALFSGCDPKAYEHAQIVQVCIPKSLFAHKMEIYYSGEIDLEQGIRLWYPQTPCTPATINVTAMLPSRFRLTLPGQSIDECTDNAWRICRWQVGKPQSDCPLKIELVSEPL
mgnify:CR=1 FL=1